MSEVTLEIILSFSERHSCNNDCLALQLRCRHFNGQLKTKRQGFWCYLTHLPLIDEVLTVCSCHHAVSVLPKGWLVARAIEGAGSTAKLRGVTFLVGVDSEVVHSVRVIEESDLFRVRLNVPPATTLPAAWNKVQGLVHSDLVIHLLVLGLLHRRSPHPVRADMGGGLWDEVRVSLWAHTRAGKAWHCISLTATLANNFISVWAKGTHWVWVPRMSIRRFLSCLHFCSLSTNKLIID